MKNKIICIGREFGSGGHEIAVLLGQKLGLKVYEKDILHMACKYGDLQVSRMEAADEKATNPYLFETVHEGNYHVARGLPTSEVLFRLQSHEIKRIAAQEDCIFVGRCADFLLKDSGAAILSVFVSAPVEQRIQRKMEQEKLSHHRAKSLVQKMDVQRRKYYEHYTKESWGRPERYDLYIDSSRQSMEDIVLLIQKYYEELE
ncbi:MAG: AAA family ATPase [Faecousia sp.]